MTADPMYPPIMLECGQHGKLLSRLLRRQFLVVRGFDGMPLNEFWDLLENRRRPFIIGVGGNRRLVETLWDRAVSLDLKHLSTEGAGPEMVCLSGHIMPDSCGCVPYSAGCVIMDGVTVRPGARLGLCCLLNTGCLVEHDCVIGDFAHVAPRAVILGGVTVGRGAMVGANATVLPSITIGDNAVVGAGAVVTKSVPPGTVVVGNPAKPLRERRPE